MVVICGCTDKKSIEKNTDKYKSDAIVAGSYAFDEEIAYVYPYENKFYTVNHNEGSIGYYDPNTMQYGNLCAVEKGTVDKIYIDDTGIYTAGNHVVYHIDFTGEIINKVELPEIDVFSCRYSPASNSKYIAVSVFYNTESGTSWENLIYVIDKETNGLKSYEYKELKRGDTLQNILPTENSDEFALIGNYQAYYFNAESGDTEVMYDDTNNCIFDYSLTEKNMYYLDMPYTDDAIIEIGKIEIKEAKKEILRTTEMGYIFPEIKSSVEKKGGTANSPWWDSLYCTDSGYIVWDISNSEIYVMPKEVNDTGEKITVVYRYPPSVTTRMKSNYEEEFGWMNGMMARMNTQFEEENKIAVNTEGYAYDRFTENLRLKLLAGDDDYDVVMLEHADELLASILNYGLYLPLETYDSISNGFDKYFDGVRDAMTYDGHIFGIPYCLQANGYVSEDDTLEKLGTDYTLDDFWNLCEEFGSQQILNSNNLTNHETFYSIISSIIEDGMRKGEISRDVILDCIESYSEYNKA